MDSDEIDTGVDGHKQQDSKDLSFSFTPVANAILMPSAKLLGKELMGLLKVTIDSFKQTLQGENLRSHFKSAQENGITGESFNTTLKADLLEKWMDGARNSEPEDKELFDLWQKILAGIALGRVKDTAIIDTLKSLSHAEVHFLLSLNATSVNAKLERFNYVPSSDNRMPYYYQKLVDKGLLVKEIEPKTFAASIIFIVFFGFSCLAMFSLLFTATNNFSLVLLLAFLAMSFGLFVFNIKTAYISWRNGRWHGYGFSWIANELLSLPR